MDLPLVSIIIPAFNRAEIIKETLDSIINQTYSNWECIIVDDVSSDSTLSVLNEYSKKDVRIKVFTRPNTKLKGANACRNYGLSLAQGYYCIFFDSDDIMATTCLEQRVIYFSKHYDLDFLVFSMGVFKKKMKFETYPHRKVVNLTIKETIEEFILSDILPWNVCRPIFKTDLIQNKVGFNEKIQNFQDEEFNIRLLSSLKPNYLSIDITDSYYRFDDASVNKYNSLKGTQDIVDCFYEYYATVFNALSNEQKRKHSKQLKIKFLNQVRFYVIPKVNKKVVFQTIKLFKKELGFNSKELVIINLTLVLNTYFYNKKGYHFISNKIKFLMN